MNINKDFSSDEIKKYFSNVSHIITSIESIPKFTQILRSVKSKEEYDWIAWNIFYELKYDVSASKMSEFKKFLLRFRKPAVNEIKNLYVYFL